MVSNICFEFECVRLYRVWELPFLEVKKGKIRSLFVGVAIYSGYL